MTEDSGAHGEGALQAADPPGAIPGLRRPWASPMVITSEVSDHTGVPFSQSPTDQVISGTNFGPS